MAPNASTLEEIVRVIETKICRSGEVITRLIVNNMSLTEVDEARLSSTPAEQVESIVAEITAVKSLISETIESSQLYSNSLKKLSLKLADQFRFEETQEVHKNMGALVDGLHSLVTAGELIDQVLKTGNSGLEGWKDLNQGLVRQLSDIEGAYTRRDFVLLADQIEYDLSRTLDEYATTLGKHMDSSSERELP
jgi:hypothetical protein